MVRGPKFRSAGNKNNEVGNGSLKSIELTKILTLKSRCPISRQNYRKHIEY